MSDPIREVCDIFQKHKKRDGASCSGLMVPNELTFFSYDKPAVAYRAGVAEGKDGSTRIWCSIASIDDAGVTLHYPPAKSLQNGQGQFKRLADWLESLLTCPSPEQIDEFCKDNNCTADYW